VWEFGLNDAELTGVYGVVTYSCLWSCMEITAENNLVMAKLLGFLAENIKLMVQS
jgi:hypothetical protein